MMLKYTSKVLATKATATDFEVTLLSTSDLGNTIFGRKLPTGSWQLYSIGGGSISKVAVVKPETVDWSNTLNFNGNTHGDV